MDKKSDIVFIIIFCLLLGFFIGILFKTPYTLGIKTFFHNISVKLNPDTQKDSKTLIIDKATKDAKSIDYKNIFDEPKTKENKFIIIIKRIFNKKKHQTTIDNVIIN